MAGLPRMPPHYEEEAWAPPPNPKAMLGEEPAGAGKEMAPYHHDGPPAHSPPRQAGQPLLEDGDTFSTHPSHLKAWSVAREDMSSSEVGVVVRISSLERVNTADKEIVLHIQRLAYRLFKREEEPELLATVRATLGGVLSGVCPWQIVEDYCPNLKIRRLVREPVVTAKIAWVDAQVDPDDPEQWTKLTVGFEHDMRITLRDPAPAWSFPFDWHHYVIDIVMEPTEECPNGILRGLIDDHAGFAFQRWSASHKRMSLAHRRNVMRSGDPTHDHGTYVDQDTNKLMKHSALRVEQSHVPDWKLYIHRNDDTDPKFDPWPYWVTTKGTDAQGLGANVQMRFWMRRQPYLYLCNAMLPVLFVEFVALFSFCIEYEQLADRERLLSTLMVLVFAIRFSCNNAVPNVGYMTMYDIKFLLGMIVLVEIFMLQHLYVLFGDALLSESSMDQVMMVISIISVVLVNLFFWLVAAREYKTLPEDGIVAPVRKDPPPRPAPPKER